MFDVVVYTSLACLLVATTEHDGMVSYFRLRVEIFQIFEIGSFLGGSFGSVILFRRFSPLKVSNLTIVSICGCKDLILHFEFLGFGINCSCHSTKTMKGTSCLFWRRRGLNRTCLSTWIGLSKYFGILCFPYLHPLALGGWSSQRIQPPIWQS